MSAIATPVITDRRADLSGQLREARQRTLALVGSLNEEQLNRQYTPLLSPLIWDLGHIANFEELWIVQTVGGREPLDGALGRFYDAIENPRAGRAELPILRGAECLAYLAAVRERTLEVLAQADLADTDPMIRDGFVFELILAHERQHNETMLQLLQMIDGYELSPGVGEFGGNKRAETRPPQMVEVEGGVYEVGAPDGRFAYDNERPRHEVEVAPFRIDHQPVTNGEFAAFVSQTGAESPMYWEADGDEGWLDTRFGRRDPVSPEEPVIHIDFAQADGYAAWAGKRLPTEHEWEIAATAGALAGTGRVWEWTSTPFTAYPGFTAFPYREYSEPFFGEGHRVLRGGSWATHPSLATHSFRNWDLPQRRQIFSGLRCAMGA